MYNEEKKLITDIQRKKDLDRNLALFAGVASKANYEYACHKFTLNYLTLKDMHMDGDVPDDPYIAQCQAVIDKLIGDFVVGDTPSPRAGRPTRTPPSGPSTCATMWTGWTATAR